MEFLTVSVWCNKCAVLKAKEKDQQLKFEQLNNSKTHATLDLVLQEHELADKDALSKVGYAGYPDF